jgi:hypothetical protein
MGHIFISYSHLDAQYVHKLAETLEEEGFEVWIDSRIHYGTEWPKVVTRNLDSSDGVIVVLSSNSYESDMVQNEVARAREKRKPIFPILLEGENWLIVQARQFVDVRDGSLPTESFYRRLAGITSRKNETAERKAAEEAKRAKAEKIAREELEREIAEQARREKEEHEAAERAMREKAKRARQERLTLRIAGLKEIFYKSFHALRGTLVRAIPILRIAGILGLISLLCWAGWWAFNQFLSPAPSTTLNTPSDTRATAVFTRSPTFLPTTIEPTVTRTMAPTPFVGLEGEVSSFTWVRTGPGENYRALITYNKGEGLQVLGKNQDGTWLVVLLSDGTTVGWISSEDIKVSAQVHILPVATPPPTQTPEPAQPTSGPRNTPDACVRAQRDYQDLQRAFGSSQGDPNYDSGSDLNGDGHVNILDFQIMSNNWPPGCPSP